MTAGWNGPVAMGCVKRGHGWGLQFRYSGGGTTVVQQLLIDVAGGRDFPSIMDDLVLGPLGMRHSTFRQPLPDHLGTVAASGHWSDGRPIAGKWQVYPEMAAAGLWTTPTDLAKERMLLRRERQKASFRI